MEDTLYHKETKMAHLPFKVVLNYDNILDEEIEGRHTIKDADDWNIARIWEHPAPSPEEDANFIVQACNSFNDLLEALEILTEHAQEKYPHFESHRGQQDINRALKAIDKAKGK
jgi:hypothetical protein